MENRILEIEKYHFHGDVITFAGTARNAKKFDLFQIVFIRSGGKMYQCKIVGIELPPKDNPDYIYKIELPKDFIHDTEARISLTCEHIFSSIDEAKESALKEIERKYKNNLESIEKFFKQYE